MPTGKKAATPMFGVGALVGNKALKAFKAGTRGAQILKSLGTGAIADFVAFDGKEAGTRELRDAAESLHKAALRGETPSHAVGTVGPEEAARVKAATGYNILLHRRTLHAEDVMHGMDRHNRQAAAIGERPITYADMARYSEILDSSDVISRGDRPNSIICEKRFPDRTLYVSEQILKGNNLEFRSMYKNKVAEWMRSVLLLGGPARGIRKTGEEE